MLVGNEVPRKGCFEGGKKIRNCEDRQIKCEFELHWKIPHSRVSGQSGRQLVLPAQTHPGEPENRGRTLQSEEGEESEAWK